MTSDRALGSNTSHSVDPVRLPKSTGGPNCPPLLAAPTVTLSNFAVSNSLGLLVRRYGQRLLVTSEVLDEIAAGVVAGYPALDTIEEHVRSGRFSQTALNGPERVVFGELLRHLGAGEASFIAVATCRNGVVVTDDRAARASCAERKVLFTGTIGILKASCLEGHIAVDEAEHALALMIRNGFYAPVNRICDIL